MSLPLLKRNISAIVKVLFTFFCIVTIYTVVIIYMYDPKLSDMLNDYQLALPEMMKAVGMSGIATNLLEFIRIYLYGFIMMIFPMVVSIIAVNRTIVQHVDSGSMATILATPNSRMRILFTNWISIVCSVTLLIAAVTGVGIVFSEMQFPGELDTKQYLVLNGVMILVHLALASMIFLAGCIFNDAKKYYFFGAGVPVIFFLFQLLSNMGGKLENLKYFTIFTLFPAEKITAGEGDIMINVVALLAITVICSVLGFIVFKKKDLPL